MVKITGILRKRRKELGLSQKAVALAAKCSQELVSKAERGLPISVPSAKRIATVLGINWKELFEE